jgi:aspartate beta-hydroxylase
MSGQVEELSDPVEAFLLAEGAGELPHARGRTLDEHLLGTREILRRWSLPDWLCDAGALHSIYGTDIYRHQLIPIERRSEVRALVGEKAERLSYLFATVSRRDLFSRLALDEEIPSNGWSIECSPTMGAPADLAKNDVEALLLIHLANQAEQACDADGGPGLWLAQAGQIGRLLGETETRPWLSSSVQVISPEHEREARSAYAAGLGAMLKDRAEASRHLKEAAKLCPCAAEPAVWLAYLALQEGALDDARTWADCARRALSGWGTPWDKRLSYEEWSWLIAFASGEVADLAERGPLPAPDPSDLPRLLEALERRTWVRVYLGSPERAEQEQDPAEAVSGAARFQQYVAAFADREREGRIDSYPGLRARPFHDPASIPLARALESHYPQIQHELESFEDQAFHSESEPIQRAGNWEVVFFNERGRLNEEMAARCPVTHQIIQGHRAVKTLAGLSYVSRMRSGTHIMPHCGPTNLRLRCHLGLRIPAGNCGIRVDGRLGTWEEGKCLVFDDSFAHEAWNHCAGDRVVLVVDVWHPDLTDEEIVLLEGLHWYAATQGASLKAYWALNDAARERR